MASQKGQTTTHRKTCVEFEIIGCLVCSPSVEASEKDKSNEKMMHLSPQKDRLKVSDFSPMCFLRGTRNLTGLAFLSKNVWFYTGLLVRAGVIDFWETPTTLLLSISIPFQVELRSNFQWKRQKKNLLREGLFG